MIVRSILTLVLLCGLAEGLAADRASAALTEEILVIPAIADAEPEHAPAPRIALEQPADFIDPNGALVTIAPGTYAVEATTEPGLRLTDQRGGLAFTVGAGMIHHEETLSKSTAALILTDSEVVHLVLLHPDGTALDAFGSLSRIHSRAPSSSAVSTTPLTPGQIQQGMQALGGIIQPAGVPPPPVLSFPLVGHSIAAWGESFQWQPGAGEPTPSSYRLCLAEVGAPCARPDQASTSSVIIDSLSPTARSFRVTGAMLGPLLAYGQQKNLIWTVGACVRSSTLPQLKGSIGGASGQVTCQYARPRQLTWKRVLATPIPNSPEPLINDRPQLSIKNPVDGVHHYIFCLIDPRDQSQAVATICEDISRRYSVHRAGASFIGTQTALVNIGTSLGTFGWEWKYEARFLPTTQANVNANVSVVDILPALNNNIVEWSVGACLDESLPCSWSTPIELRILPKTNLVSIRKVPDNPARYRIEWQPPPSGAVTHYRLCLATRGTPLQIRAGFSIELIYTAGMLRDLCSGDIPVGHQPAYLRPLPPEAAALCPAGGCRMPRPLKTISVTGTPAYILDLREHPDLATVGGQPLAVAVAACGASNRNCLWWWQGGSSFLTDLPPVSLAPNPVSVRYGPTSVSLEWPTTFGNDFYIPCVRELSATCDSGNLVNQSRLNSPRAGTPQGHPHACSLSGPSLSGVKAVQVAGCNDAWGCRWSGTEQFNFTSIRLPASQSELRCRP